MGRPTHDNSYKNGHDNISSPEMVRDFKGGDLSPFNTRRKTAWQRAFGPMGQGSIRGSIFALCAVAIGSGVLSLPYVLR